MGIDFRERGREGGEQDRERETLMRETLNGRLLSAPSRDQTQNLGLCPDQ